ncbi:vWA domain-containing protein [Polluticoccus soli]|uniref:vWA domain-containing protein n=1 Tax=Polluticoccus soli TaxID=3034150 RepID=UPI0023E18C49|nr:VWA domain-containing protein [Flavipsychrobacter sp. JY13-12]
MKGFVFSEYSDEQNNKTPFERLFGTFMELLQYTNGDAAEALSWLTQLDREYDLSSDEYGIGDFIEDLKTQGYLSEDELDGSFKITAKTEQTIRKQSLEEIFGKLKKTKTGSHHTFKSGKGDEINPETRPYEFGDALEAIDFTGSLRNSFVNHGIEQFNMQQDDLEIFEMDFKTQTSTVLMIDISHSMILYGEDRITPAKKVAMALSELITTRYPKDTLDIVVFGNDAWQIEMKDLPYLQVGPYHTNTVAGLELAMDILRRRKNPNKQIFMITDGKPTCLKIGNKYYKNSFGIDSKILNRTLNLAGQLKRLKIPVITFMIASDMYLQRFVRTFTEVNGGKAFYSSLDGLGQYIFEDYERNKKKRLR